ncbi:MAG: hypothetical protein IKN34_04850, partial [Treponema sp.]|nr:hypothetical protein [Treponema sp.]
MKQLYKMRGGVIVSLILMLAFFIVGCKTDDDDDGETPSPTSYTITIAEGIEHGSVSASPTTAAAGATVTLTATPADGYKLASLTVTNAGGASVTTTKDSGDTSKYTFIMPASNVTVSAVFVEESAATYTITIADSIEHGSVSAEPTTAAAGTTVTLTVTLADGYELESITVKDANSADVAVTQDASNKSKYTFTMPESDVTVSATFTEEATTLSTPLTLKALTAGTIVVKDPMSGMQYSKNGGAKTAVTSEAIDVAEGDTVAFYGSGTNIT